MKLCPKCGNETLPYELRRWGFCIECKMKEGEEE